ncbi:coiled-coil domain-containing protein mad1 [Pleurotus pulmonarius]|nr:coiled-coil domain-containing protein mad1 [Pleurotus pulmonarius]
MSDPFRTPSTSKLNGLPFRSSAVKRDTLAAELEKDPQLSTAKRQQRSQALTSNMAYASLERQLAAVKTTKIELEAKLREKDVLIEQLERDRRWFSDLEKKEKEEKERERAEHDEERSRTEAELRSLRTMLNDLREQHADTEDALSSLSRSSKHTIASQSTSLTSLTRQNAILTASLAESERIAASRAHELTDVQSELEALRALKERVDKGAKDVETMGVVRDELHRQAGHTRKLEMMNERLSAEVRGLRERQTSVEVLREEKRALERKVAGLEEMREKAIRLEAEVEAARRERAERAHNDSQSSVSVSVTSALSELRLSHAQLLEDHGATTASLRERDARIGAMARELAESQETVSVLEKSIRVYAAKLERTEGKALLAERQVGFLKAMLASYDAEAAHDNQQSKMTDTDAGSSSMLRLRVNQLEEMVDEYRKANDGLIKSLDDIGVDPLSGGKDIQRLKQELSETQSARATLESDLKARQEETQEQLARIDKLEQELFELSGEVAGGRHVPPGVRVLSMKDNPEEKWFNLRQEALDRLRGENEALMARLRELEDQQPPISPNNVPTPSSNTPNAPNASTSSPAHLVPRESYELALNKTAALAAELAQKDTRLQRLQQVFASKSAEFREAIASILGVKLAFYPNGQVRVTSIFDLNASFVFQPERKGGGTMQLVGQGESVSEDLLGLMQTWIVKEQCIPAFVALVTLDCYEKAKAAGEV